MMSGPTKAAREAIAATQKPREKSLERTYKRTGTIAGIGCYALLIVALVLIIAGLVGGYINVM